MPADAPVEVRGELGSIRSTLPGCDVCELLPHTSRVMHNVTEPRQQQLARTLKSLYARYQRNRDLMGAVDFVIHAIVDKTKWGTLAMGGVSLSVAVMVVRMSVIWTGA